MTQRSAESRLRMLRQGDRITAKWLNEVAARAERRPRRADDITEQEPVGQDGEGTQPEVVLTEFARVTSIVRIEDQSDPTVFVDIERIDALEMRDLYGTKWTLVFDNT